MNGEGDGAGRGSEEPLAAFCRDLLQLRLDAGLTLRELEKVSGYSKSALSKAASGTSLPSLELTEAYAGACKADTDAWRARWHQVDTHLRSAAAPPGTAQPAVALEQDTAASAARSPRPIVKIAAAPLILATALIATLILVSRHDSGTGDVTQVPPGTTPAAGATATAGPASPATPSSTSSPAQAGSGAYTPVYTHRNLSLRDYNDYFDLIAGTVVTREGAWTLSTNAGGDSHGAFELQPLTDAYLAGRTVPTAAQCATGLAHHPTRTVRFPAVPPGAAFCLRNRATGDIAVVQVNDLDYGNWAADVFLTYYRHTAAPSTTL